MKLNRPAVIMRDITYTYRDAGQRHPVLRELSAEFGAARFTTIVGRSGSGKSTLLNLIAGIDLPDSGQITVHEQELTALDEQARTELRRRDVGLVFQFFNLIPTLTVLENIRLPLELNGTDTNNATEQALQLLQNQELADRGMDFPEQLSGGQQQRVAILRAVVHRPYVVLADEPTGNLDRENELKILQLLTSLPADHGCAVIAVSHSDEVAERADRHYLLQDGVLIEQ